MATKYVILKHLGPLDSENQQLISDFLGNLVFSKSGVPVLFETFHAKVKANGGDDFSKEFVKEFYDVKIKNLENGRNGDSNLNNNLKSTSNNISSNTFNDRNFYNKRPREEDDDDNEVEEKVEQENEHKIYSKGIESKRKQKIYQGYVTSLQPYGAFISFDNKSGLCHVSQIDIDGNPISHPSDVLYQNQLVNFIIVDEKVERGRTKYSLSMRGVVQDEVEEEEPHIQNVKNNEKEEEEKKIEKEEGKKIEKEEVEYERATHREVEQDKDKNLGENPPHALKEAKLEEHDAGISLTSTAPTSDSKDTATTNSQATEDYDPLIADSVNIPHDSLFGGSNINSVLNMENSLPVAIEHGSALARQFREEKAKKQKVRDKVSRSVEENDPLYVKKEKPEQEDGQLKQSMASFKKNKPKKLIKQSRKSIQELRKSLPIYKMKRDLINQIRDNQFLVIVGETGSGKTTQIVQYIYEVGLNQSKIIGCTQPRRVAATSVARRVAEEMDVHLGGLVGYNVRFDDKTSTNTKIKYLTDGMLLREALTDPSLSKYSVIMLDEAHERTIATDVLFGLLKKAAKANPNLKVIVTSATLDSNKFSKFFNSCPVINIPGRTFPVDIVYTNKPEMDYLAAAIDSVCQIHISEPAGDILVFLTGQEEIEVASEILQERMKMLQPNDPLMIILPCYSSLPSDEQLRIFEETPAGMRKVVLATNIAETSLTIDGIKYVVDSGYCKLNLQDVTLGLDMLKICPISQAQASQRSGRAGRTGPGKCYRLYTESIYSKLAPSSTPEIRRRNLASSVLMLKAMHLSTFEWMDPPSMQAVNAAYKQLKQLKALDEKLEITKLGVDLSKIPTEPSLAKCILLSEEMGCTMEMLAIVAMLSIQNVFHRPKAQRKLADQVIARWTHSISDHITLLRVYTEFVKVESARKLDWCKRNFVQHSSLRKAQQIVEQLRSICRFNNRDLQSKQKERIILNCLTNGLSQIQIDGSNRDLISRRFKTGDTVVTTGRHATLVPRKRRRRLGRR